MKRVGLGGVLVWLALAQPGAAAMYNAIFNKPYFMGELAIMASRCGVRDKVWATRLMYHFQASFPTLDWSALGPKTGLSAEALQDRMMEGARNAEWVLANKSAACTEYVKNDLLDEADKIVWDKKPVWDADDFQ